MLLSFFVLLLCFFLLAIICDDFFVPALEKLATRWKMSSEVAWATLLAMGSSAPELFTSLFAILNPTVSASLWAWTIVGSAIFNILIIVGASVLVRGAIVKLQRQPIIRDLVFYSISVWLLLRFFWDGKATLSEMLIFVVVYIIYIICVKYRSTWLNYDGDLIEEEQLEETKDHKEGWILSQITSSTASVLSYIIPKSPGWAFMVTIVLIWVCTHFMVEAWVHVAQWLWMSEALIWLTILAAGTSIPDLLGSLIVARKWKADMAVSNAVWSNIFDILFGLWVPYVIYFLFVSEDNYITVATENLTASILLLLATVITMLFLLIVRKWKLWRSSGYLLIWLYIAFIIYSVMTVL